MPGMPKKKKNDYNVWNLPGVVAGRGGTTSVGIGGGPTIYNNPKSMPKDKRLRRYTDFIKAQGSPTARGLSPLGTYSDRSLSQNYSAAIKEANKDDSYTDKGLDELSGLTFRQVGDQINAMAEMQKDGGGGSWYDGLWEDAKELGIKGWGEIGIGAMNAYTGWQEAEMAKKQHALARETFDFQKAAYQQDREGRVLAYNTNAQNVNAWKAAQGRTDLNKLMV